jgi:AcrR family transcriptional regulator
MTNKSQETHAIDSNALPSSAKARGLRPGQPGGRRDTNRKERTKALQDAALELFLVDGLEAVTIEDITNRAEVAKGSFYRYFDDKGVLVKSLFDPFLSCTLRAFDESEAALERARTPSEIIDGYSVLGNGLVECFAMHRSVVRLYLQENRCPPTGARVHVRDAERQITARAVKYSRPAMERGFVKPMPPEFTASVVIGAGERLLFQILSDESGSVPEDLVSLLLEWCLEGVRNRN